VAILQLDEPRVEREDHSPCTKQSSHAARPALPLACSPPRNRSPLSDQIGRPTPSLVAELRLQLPQDHIERCCLVHASLWRLISSCMRASRAASSSLDLGFSAAVDTESDSFSTEVMLQAGCSLRPQAVGATRRVTSIFYLRLHCFQRSLGGKIRSRDPAHCSCIQRFRRDHESKSHSVSSLGGRFQSHA
jgi:hypothetical protein